MNLFLILTAFTVSIDSFACGFSLSFNNNKKFIVVGVIAFTVFVMCVTVNYFTYLFTGILSEKTASLGGLGLIAVGIYNLLKKDTSGKKDKNIVKQSLITGFSVGLDGAFANLSLAVMGLNGFYVPLTIAIMHAVMVYLGITLSKIKFISKIEKFSFIPPLIIIFLGIYKLSGIFS